MGWFLPLQNLYAEVLTPNASDVSIFEDRIFTKLIKLKMLGHVLIQYDWYPYNQSESEHKYMKGRSREDTGEMAISRSK